MSGKQIQRLEGRIVALGRKLAALRQSMSQPTQKSGSRLLTWKLGADPCPCLFFTACLGDGGFG
jgi:hypothetical protein